MAAVPDYEEVREDIDDEVFRAGNQAEDIAMVLNLGFEVDNANKPAPKNVPAADTPAAVDGGLYEGQHWGWDGIDCRATIQGSMYNGPTFAHNWTLQNKMFAEVFLRFFLPTTFLEGTVLVATNDALRGENSAMATLGEFLHYLGFGC